jgi:hypothetical protein
MALRPSYHAYRTGFRQSAIDRIAGSPNGNDKLALIPNSFIGGLSYSEVADRIVESIVSISVDDAKTTFAKPAHAAMAALLAVTPGAKSESAYAEMSALLGERYIDAVWAVDNDKSPADVMAARNVDSNGFRTVLDGGWTAETIKEYGVGIVRALPRDWATVAASGLDAKTLRAWIKVSTGLSIRHIVALAATDVSPETLREHTKGLGMTGDHIVAVARIGVARVQALRAFRGRTTRVGCSFLWSQIDTPEFADAILSLWSADQIDEEREGKTVNSDRLRALLDAGITPAQIGDASRAGVPFGDWTPELFATDLWEAGRAHREACDTQARAWWVEDGCRGMLDGLWPWTAGTYADRSMR